MNKENKYVVYIHYDPITLEPFYIGQGTKERAYAGSIRNRYWYQKVVNQGGYLVDVVFEGIDKKDAEYMEICLGISLIDSGYQLTNIYLGKQFSSGQVMVDKTKSYWAGKKNHKFSESLKKWNYEHRGENSPNFGRKRLDVSLRNKNGNFKRYNREIICVETGEKFDKLKDAKEWLKSIGKKNWNNIGAAASSGDACSDFHWRYVKDR